MVVPRKPAEPQRAQYPVRRALNTHSQPDVGATFPAPITSPSPDVHPGGGSITPSTDRPVFRITTRRSCRTWALAGSTPITARNAPPARPAGRHAPAAGATGPTIGLFCTRPVHALIGRYKLSGGDRVLGPTTPPRPPRTSSPQTFLIASDLPSGTEDGRAILSVYSGPPCPPTLPGRRTHPHFRHTSGRRTRRAAPVKSWSNQHRVGTPGRSGVEFG